MCKYEVYAYNPKNCRDRKFCIIESRNMNDVEREFYKIYNEKYKIINIYRKEVEYGN